MLRRRGGGTLFPELSLTSYAIDDLPGQQASLVHGAIAELTATTADLLPVIIVGAPLRQRDRLFNTEVMLHPGSALRAVAEDPPAQLSRVLRAAAVRLR